MKSMQRQFGKLGRRSANEADVQSVLDEFKAVDNMLDVMLRDLKLWRDGWGDMLRFQHDASEAFATLYNPIDTVDGNDDSRHQPAQTPARYTQKCMGLQREYSHLRSELEQEVAMIEAKLIRPVETAKLSAKALHKTVKYRENVKLDYERYLGRAEHVRKKEVRSQKDEAALSAHESNLAQARIDYQTADEQVKQTFPPFSDAVLSLLPLLLTSMIMLQTEMVGQLYTVCNEYTLQHGLPNPAPSDREIVAAWDREFTTFRKELESSLRTIARGKVVNLSMELPAERDKTTVSGLGIRNKILNRDKGDQPLPIRATPGPRHSPSFDAASALSAQEEPAAPPKPPRPGPPASNGSYKQRIPSVTGHGMPSPSTNNGFHAGSNQPPPVPYPSKSPSPTPYPLKSPSPRPPGLDSASSLHTPSRYLTPPTGISPSPQAFDATGAGAGTPDYFSVARRTSQTSIASSVASSAAAAAAAKKKPPPPPIPAKRPSGLLPQFVTALYDFEGQNAGDLAFAEGDRIRVVKKTESTDDWWEGELRGRVGAFPANYVKL